jgi:uncharacterized protein YjbJ (UPF0337 family)
MPGMIGGVPPPTSEPFLLAPTPGDLTGPSVSVPDEMEFTMGFDDRIKNTAEEVAGRVKEWVGGKTDNEQLEAEGKFDQTSAKTKQAVEAVKGDLKTTLSEASDKVTERVGDLSDKVADKADEVKDGSGS